MERNAIIEKLRLIFREIFSNPSLVLTDKMTANDVENWNSLTHMLMIAEVEKQFGIKFKLKDLNKIKQVADLISIIENKSE
jgi:acyl carrier protein